jgi:hypothetical protein
MIFRLRVAQTGVARVRFAHDSRESALWFHITASVVEGWCDGRVSARGADRAPAAI